MTMYQSLKLEVMVRHIGVPVNVAVHQQMTRQRYETDLLELGRWPAAYLAAADHPEHTR